MESDQFVAVAHVTAVPPVHVPSAAEAEPAARRLRVMAQGNAWLRKRGEVDFGDFIGFCFL